MGLEARIRGTLRHRLSHLLRAEGGFVTARGHAGEVLVPQAEAQMRLPAAVGDYTDFYASIFHATNVGSMFRPDNPLLPNYRWVPIGYHGRASSLVVSGTPVRRPEGQTAPREEGRPPGFGPSRSFDYELEVGAFLGPGNAPRDPGAAGPGRGSPLRPLPGQRLVGSRRPAVGVPAPGPVPVQELRHLAEPLGGDGGGAGALPGAGLHPGRGRSRAAPPPAARRRRGARRLRPAPGGSPVVGDDAPRGRGRRWWSATPTCATSTGPWPRW